MSTIDGEDRFMVQRGLTTYQLPASEMSTIQDDDLMLVARGSDHYKVSGADVLAQLGGGGGEARAAFRILEGPDAGTTINLLDPSLPNPMSYLFQSGQTYKIESLDSFLCWWDICGEGINGGNGSTDWAKNPNPQLYPNIPGVDTVLSCPFFIATAGAGTGGGGGKGRKGSSGIGGTARVNGSVPGDNANDLAEITLRQGSGGSAGSGGGANGGNAPSPVPQGALFDTSKGGATGGSSTQSTDKDRYINGGGGGGGSGSFIKLDLMMMFRNLELDLTLAPGNSAAGIRYVSPARALAKKTDRILKQLELDNNPFYS